VAGYLQQRQRDKEMVKLAIENQFSVDVRLPV
jgi:hypothetical protein